MSSRGRGGRRRIAIHQQVYSIEPPPDVYEGAAAGTQEVVLNVRRGGNFGYAGTVDWSVAGFGTNPATTADFGGSWPSGQLAFDILDDLKTITLTISGNDSIDGDREYVVSLSNPTTSGGSGVAVIGVATVFGRILDDDVQNPTTFCLYETLPAYYGGQPIQYTPVAPPVLEEPPPPDTDPPPPPPTGTIATLRTTNGTPGQTLTLNSAFSGQSGQFYVVSAANYPSTYKTADGGAAADDGMDVLVLSNGNVALRIGTPVAKAANAPNSSSATYSQNAPLDLSRAEGAIPGGTITTTLRVLANRHKTLAPAKELYLRWPSVAIPESSPMICDYVSFDGLDKIYIMEGTQTAAAKFGPIPFQEFTTWEDMGSSRWRCPTSGMIQQFFSRSPVAGNTAEVVCWGPAVAATTQINLGTSSWNSNYQRWTRVQTGSDWHVWCYAPSNPHTYYGRVYGTTHSMAIMWHFTDFLEVIIGGPNHRMTLLGAFQTQHRFSFWHMNHQIDGRGTVLEMDSNAASSYPQGLLMWNRSSGQKQGLLYRVQANIKDTHTLIGAGGNAFSGPPVIKSETSGTFVSSSASPNSGVATNEAIGMINWSDPGCRLMQESSYPNGTAFGSETYRAVDGKYGVGFGAENIMAPGAKLRMSYGGAGGIPWSSFAGEAEYRSVTWTVVSGTSRYTTPSTREPVALLINREDWTKLASTATPTANRQWKWQNGVVTIFSSSAPSTFRSSVLEYSRYDFEVANCGWTIDTDGSLKTYSGTTSGSKKDVQQEAECLFGQNLFQVTDVGTREHSRRFLAFEATPETPDAVYSLTAAAGWSRPDATNFPNRWQISLSTTIVGEYKTYNSVLQQFYVPGVKVHGWLRDRLSGSHVSSASLVSSPGQWNWTQTEAKSGSTNGGGGTLTIDIRYYDAWGTLRTPTRSGNNFVVGTQIIEVWACCYLLGNLTLHDIRCVNLRAGIVTVYESDRLGSMVQFSCRPEIAASPRPCHIAGTQDLYAWDEIHSGQWHHIYLRPIRQNNTYYYAAGGGRFVMSPVGVRITDVAMTGNLRIGASAYDCRIEGLTFTGDPRQAIWIDNADDATYGTTTRLAIGGSGALAVSAPAGSWILCTDPTRCHLTVNGTSVYNGTASAAQVFFWGAPTQKTFTTTQVSRPGTAPQSAIVGLWLCDGSQANSDPNALGYLSAGNSGSVTYATHDGILATNGFGQYFATGPLRRSGWGTLPDDYFATTGITLSMLAEVYSTIANTNVLMQWRPAESEYIELRMSSATTLQVRGILGSDSATASMSIYETPILDSRFHHFVLTFDASARVVRAYIDGALMLQTAAIAGTVKLGDMASTARRGFGFGGSYSTDTGTCAKCSHASVLRGVYPPS